MRRSVTPPDTRGEGADPLRKLHPIQTLKGPEPVTIVPITLNEGTAMPAEEAMALKVQWAVRAGYSILTRDIPAHFAPYNAVIRVHAGSTEDKLLDYLAVLAPPSS
ncbi:MAG: hypothetical protein PVSMB7_29560 [Chloroflexota bacterium]